MPNMKKLLLIAVLSPVGNAVVERLFSLMNITKTLLRNRLSDKTLDILLRLNKEAPETWTEEDKDKLMALWIEGRINSEHKFRWDLWIVYGYLYNLNMWSSHKMFLKVEYVILYCVSMLVVHLLSIELNILYSSQLQILAYSFHV